MSIIGQSRIPRPLAVLTLVLVAGGASAQPARDVPVADVSYSIGYMLGEDVLARLRADGVDVDNEEIARGLMAALNEEAPRIEAKRRAHLMRVVEEEVRRREAAVRLESDPAFRVLAENNLAQSMAFHQTVGQEEGVTTLPSGIQYKVVSAGSGEKATDDSMVIASFRATRIDGTLFASGAMEPVVVREALPGVQEFVKLMPAGSHWRVAIPPALAFGNLGLPPELGPNESVLVDVTIHEVRKAE